jgi:hypothetical protein
VYEDVIPEVTGLGNDVVDEVGVAASGQEWTAAGGDEDAGAAAQW